MGYNSIPPRWEDYSKIGKIIPGTQIIPFKAPLRKEICFHLSDSKLRFTVEDLVNEVHNLTLVIDLTMTTRFYNKEDFESRKIKHVKYFTKGGGNMPKEDEVKTFCNTIVKHLQDNPNGLVGVHCTHGLNRTGYFICRYMIDCLGISGPSSVELFEQSRGHVFDRENYRNFLIQRNSNKVKESSFQNDESSNVKQSKIQRIDRNDGCGYEFCSTSRFRNESFMENKNNRLINMNNKCFEREREPITKSPSFRTDRNNLSLKRGREEQAKPKQQYYSENYLKKSLNNTFNSIEFERNQYSNRINESMNSFRESYGDKDQIHYPLKRKGEWFNRKGQNEYCDKTYPHSKY